MSVVELILERKLEKVHDRIEQLEERMRGADALIVLWETRATRAEAHIERLEAALRKIANDADYYGQRAQMYKKIARAALDQSSPPSATE